MTTSVSGHPRTACLGVQAGATVLVYHDRNGDGRVAPSEYIQMGPADEPFLFADGEAVWSREKKEFLPLYPAGAPVLPAVPREITEAEWLPLARDWAANECGSQKPYDIEYAHARIAYEVFNAACRERGIA